jgi:hypothetical protein
MSNISKNLNRDFYIKMRIGGTSHKTIINSIFPPDRASKFLDDIKGLEDIDYTKKVNIEKLIENSENTKIKTKK